jgi:pimeloyl-ACP methyl ester carboxylesterase
MKSAVRILIALCLLSVSGCGLFVTKIPAGKIPDATPKDRSITVKGVNYHYIEYPGPGKTVILLHGFAASTYTWEKVAPILAREGFHVYALDLKGFGWSDKPLDSRYDVGAFTEDVDDWMNQLNLKNTVFVGNSMGGAIATLLSSLHPEKVDKMVLIDAGGYPMPLPTVIKLEQLPLAAFFGNLYLSRWIVRHNLKQVMFDKKKVTDDVVEAYYTRLCTVNAIDVQVKTARSIDFSREDFIETAIRKNGTKTLIIWGRDDEWIPLKTVGYRFRNDLVNSTISIIPECGHIPQEEHPEKTAALILDFINDRPITDEKPGQVIDKISAP